MEVSGTSVARKSVLLVLFVPSVERDGVTPVDQDYWVDEALETLGTVFGGATAYPRAKGSGAMTSAANGCATNRS